MKTQTYEQLFICLLDKNGGQTNAWILLFLADDSIDFYDESNI